MDGAGSYSVAHRAGLLPTELTGMWGWILLRSPHRGRGSLQPPPPLSKGLVRATSGVGVVAGAFWDLGVVLARVGAGGTWRKQCYESVLRHEHLQGCVRW